MNVGIATVVEFLQKKGYTVEANPNTKISEEQYALLVKEFSKDKNLRIESERFIQERQNKERNKATVSINGYDDAEKTPAAENVIKTVVPEEARPKFKPVGKIDLDKIGKRTAKEPEPAREQSQAQPAETPAAAPAEETVAPAEKAPVAEAPAEAEAAAKMPEPPVAEEPREAEPVADSKPEEAQQLQEKPEAPAVQPETVLFVYCGSLIEPTRPEIQPNRSSCEDAPICMVTFSTALFLI